MNYPFAEVAVPTGTLGSLRISWEYIRYWSMGSLPSCMNPAVSKSVTAADYIIRNICTKVKIELQDCLMSLPRFGGKANKIRKKAHHEPRSPHQTKKDAR